MRKTIDSDFSGQNTPVVIITNAVKGNSNCEKHLDNNEDTIEDGVRNIRGDIVTEKNPFSDFIDVKECQE